MNHKFKPGALVMCRCIFCKDETYPLLIIKQAPFMPHLYYGDRSYIDILTSGVWVKAELLPKDLHPADAFTLYDEDNETQV